MYEPLLSRKFEFSKKKKTLSFELETNYISETFIIEYNELNIMKK